MRSFTWGPQQGLLAKPWAPSTRLGGAHKTRVPSLPALWSGPAPRHGFPAWPHLHGPAQWSLHYSSTLTHRVTAQLDLGPPSLLPHELGWWPELATISGAALPATWVFTAPAHCTACCSKCKSKLLNIAIYLVRKCGIGGNLVREENCLVAIWVLASMFKSSKCITS